jgi:hypothetical protein
MGKRASDSVKKTAPNKKLMLLVEYKKPSWNSVGESIEIATYQITSKKDFSLSASGFIVYPQGNSSLETGYSPSSFVRYHLEEWDKDRMY